MLKFSSNYISETNTGVVCKKPYSALNLWSKDVLDIVEPSLSGTALEMALADMT